MPTTTPIAVAAHELAAVVSPRTSPGARRKIRPAPRNPTPVTTPWMTRLAPSGPSTSAPIPVTAAAANARSAKVRSPADLPRNSRSSPIAKPRRAASDARPSKASCNEASTRTA